MISTLEKRATEAPRMHWTHHPLVDEMEGGKFRRLTHEEIAAQLAAGVPQEVIVEYWQAREDRIKAADTDPLLCGFELPFWGELRRWINEKDEVYMFSANDVGKSELGGKLTCEVLTRRLAWPQMMAGAPRVLCIAQSDPASILQQEKVYKYLPRYAREWNDQPKKDRRNPFRKINWSKADGFTGNTLVLPNPKGAQCDFRTVASWMKGELSFEGFAYHWVWIDEDCPVGMWDALRVRAGKTHGKLFFTFTPVNGYGGVCKAVLGGARVIKSLPMQWEWGTANL